VDHTDRAISHRPPHAPLVRYTADDR